MAVVAAQPFPAMAPAQASNMLCFNLVLEGRMTQIFDAATAIPLAIVVLLVAWIFAITNGRRPVKLKLRGLGMNVEISPCGPPDQERSPDEVQPK